MAGIIIDGDVASQGLRFIQGRNEVESRERMHGAELQQRDRHFNKEYELKLRDLERLKTYTDALADESGARAGQTRAQTEGLRFKNAEDQRGSIAESLRRAERSRLAGDTQGFRDILLGTAADAGIDLGENASDEQLWQGVSRAARVGAEMPVRSQFARDLHQIQPGAAESVNNITGRAFAGQNLRGSSNLGMDGVSGLDAATQEITDQFAGRLETLAKQKFGGDYQAMLSDPQIREQMRGFVENHPTLNELFRARPNVSSEDAGVRLTDLGSSGAMAIGVNGKNGQRAPLTQRGSVASENPNDPAVAVGYGDLFNFIRGMSTTHGGEIGLAPAMVDAVAARTAAPGRFVSEDQLDTRARATLLGEQALPGGVDQDTALRMYAGEPVTPEAKTAYSADQADRVATAKGSAASVAAFDSPEEQATREQRVAEQMIPRVTNNIMATLRLDDTSKGVGWSDQFSESYRSGLVDTANASGEAAGSQNEAYRRAFQSDIQATLADPDNVARLARAFNMTDKFGRPITSVRDMNQAQLYKASQVVALSRKEDVMNDWWAGDRFTIGTLTDQAIEAVAKHGARIKSERRSGRREKDPVDTQRPEYAEDVRDAFQRVWSDLGPNGVLWKRLAGN